MAPAVQVLSPEYASRAAAAAKAAPAAAATAGELQQQQGAVGHEQQPRQSDVSYWLPARVQEPAGFVHTLHG